MEQPHFLLIPYSEQGHFSPMLNLASQLAALGCKVTFVKADRQAAILHADTSDTKSVAKSSKVAEVKSRGEALQEGAKSDDSNGGVLANLQFVTVPDVMFKMKMAGLQIEQQEDPFAKIVEDSKASISCVICDWMLWRWVQHVTNAYGLRLALHSSFSALAFFTGYLKYIGGKDLELEDLLVSGFGMPSPKDVAAQFGLISMRDPPEVTLEKLKFSQTLYDGIKGVGPILVNSFKDLEAPLLPLLEASGLDVRFIGPCLPAWNVNDIGLGSKLAQQAGSIFTEEEACLPWLDLQEKGSVLFVSFGSEASADSKHVEEIAMGVEKSGYKFLWVFRPNGPSSSGPLQYFREQSSKHEKGMFVSWAPQRNVLQHPSIGGFLTHSGWNSTLEGVTFGVPMLCVPLQLEQPMNASFVHAHLQVGIRLPISKDGLVNREDVANGVKALMQGQFFDRVSKFRLAAQEAIQDAHNTLASFVQDMK